MPRSIHELRYVFGALLDNPAFLSVAMITIGLLVGTLSARIGAETPPDAAELSPERPAVETSAPTDPPVAGSERWTMYFRT